MGISSHAVRRVIQALENGPLSKEQIMDRVGAQRGRHTPTQMELVGALHPKNNIRKRNDGLYELIR